MASKLKPWFNVVTPRADLREGKPLDASEFAVHLDQVRDGRAHEDYQKPARFFERTYLTKNLLAVSSEVVRRLSGEKTETSAVFNMATQFGGGKTHALTLLYHLAENGAKAGKWQGVSQVLQKAEVAEVPKAATAVFVGTEFDSIQGRGGDDGTPNRKTPWGEIAFQLSGEAGLAVLAEHEKQQQAPAGDVIRRFLPKDRPALILVDELLNYLNRSRKSGLASQMYSFMQNLSEVARGSDRVVLVASIPASLLEMSSDDEQDYDRFKKMLNRLGKAVVMSSESEASEIVRRRLFEWDVRAVSEDGRILLPADAIATCRAYADWVGENKSHVPSWFSADHAQSICEAAYPFHPMVLSVFERKWQELPRFQRTRGVLRLLALWTAHAYQLGFKGAHKDALIDLGTAPLEDPMFRSAVFEQLGESRLEGAVTTDIAGRKESHAVRLDEEAVDTIRKARLHKKVATSVLFESNGGQTKSEATLPEIRLAVAGPDIDVGNVETALQDLTDACYYLTFERNRYRFSLKENLNKRFSDRRASVRDQEIDETVRETIQEVFSSEDGVERVFFPEKSAQIADQPALTFVIMAPEAFLAAPGIEGQVESMTGEHGKSARTYKSALIWILAESLGPLKDAARNLLAWEDIKDEGLSLDDLQQKQLETSGKKARRDLTEAVWRAYKHVLLLGGDGKIKSIDLGLVTSSASESMTKFVLARLRQSGEVEKDVSPRFLVRNWPPALPEWSTKGVRDAFYASPQFPRLQFSYKIKETIAKGVTEGVLGYGAKGEPSSHSPFAFRKAMDAAEVEISDDTFILTAAEAEKRVEPPKLTRLVVMPEQVQIRPGVCQSFSVEGQDQFGRAIALGAVEWTATGGEIDAQGVFTAGKGQGYFRVTAAVKGIAAVATVNVATVVTPPTPPPTKKRLVWEGSVPAQKWTNLYMGVLTKLVSSGDVAIRVRIEAVPKDGVTDQQVAETKAALKALGLSDNLDVG